MDLDHFKKFNDTMGHQVGDRLLQDLVKVLQANTRKTDLVARYGGEEFVVVYPGADVEHAHHAADTPQDPQADHRRRDDDGSEQQDSRGARRLIPKTSGPPEGPRPPTAGCPETSGVVGFPSAPLARFSPTRAGFLECAA